MFPKSLYISFSLGSDLPGFCMLPWGRMVTVLHRPDTVLERTVLQDLWGTEWSVFPEQFLWNDAICSLCSLNLPIGLAQIWEDLALELKPSLMFLFVFSRMVKLSSLYAQEQNVWGCALSLCKGLQREKVPCPLSTLPFGPERTEWKGGTKATFPGIIHSQPDATCAKHCWIYSSLDFSEKCVLNFILF